MEAVRKAIRGALEKGDTHDRAFRERVYRQTFAALDRSLQARSDLSADDVRQRREEVKAVIVEIEREHLAAARAAEEPVPPPPHPPRRTEPSPAAGAGERQVPELDPVPQVERDERPHQFAEQPQEDYIPADEMRTPLAGRERGRGRFAMLFVLATVVGAVGIGAWWTLQTGILQPAEERDTSVRTQPAIEEEDFDPGGTAPAGPASTGPDADWITIFTPDDPTTVSASPGVSVAASAQDEEDFLRIEGSDANSTVSFDVGSGVLEQLAGQRAVISLTARSGEEGETQISISCDFGALGGCGRTRYIVGSQATEYLLEVAFPDRQPTAAGRISITPDIEGQGRVLDVFSLRAARADGE